MNGMDGNVASVASFGISRMGENVTSAGISRMDENAASVSFSPLTNLPKNELINMVLQLQAENAGLVAMMKFMETTNNRMEKLEREQNKSLQYNRRNNIEITGIPTRIKTDALEDEVIKIYNAAGVKVEGRNLEKMDIEACHRIGKKGVTICRFVNRKFSRMGLINSQKLKGKELYGKDSKVYINSSFCFEFKHLNYLIRGLKKEKKIAGYKERNGINFIRIIGAEEDDFKEISHKNDLVRLELIAPENDI